jgi:CBS domain-containing protein
MKSPVQTISVVDSIELAYEHLSNSSLSCLAVIDQAGKLAGAISRTDLLRLGRRRRGNRRRVLLDFPKKSVKDVMSKGVVSVRPHETVERAAALMAEKRIHRVFVKEGRELLGVISTKDVMAAICDKRIEAPLSLFASSPLHSVQVDDPMSLATQKLESASVRGLVVTENGWPVGIFSQAEALAARDFPPDTEVEIAMNSAILVLDENTALYRACAQATALRVRRVVSMRDGVAAGILTGTDFARAAS